MDCGHLYIQHTFNKAHELIIVRDDDQYTIYDSFISYREFSGRSYSKKEFYRYITDLIESSDVSIKTSSYYNLCDPPPNYLNDWDRYLHRCWLQPLI
jgi:hypothetical protein